MKLNKGQGIIGEVLMGTAAIIIAITMFLIIESQGSGVMEQEISEEVDIQMGDVRTNTVMSNILAGKLHQIDEIDKGEYGNLSAYRVISYYFSTPGAKTYFNGKAVSRNQVKKDLKLYLGEKLHSNYQTGSKEIDYYLDFQNFNNPEDRPTKLTEKTTQGLERPEFRGTIYLANHQKIHINFFKQGEPFFFEKGD